MSLYHVLLEIYPSLETSSCSAALPCTQRYIWMFDYISTPLMAATASATILALFLTHKGVRLGELTVWIATALASLAILLFVGGEAWQLAPLPLAVFAVLTIRSHRRSLTRNPDPVPSER